MQQATEVMRPGSVGASFFTFYGEKLSAPCQPAKYTGEKPRLFTIYA